MSGGDSKWLVVMSGACSLGIFGYLDVNEIGKGWGNAAAVAGGIIGMAILEKFVAKKVPKNQRVQSWYCNDHRNVICNHL